MSPSQDPTPPTRNGKRRPDRGVDIRPLLWIVGVGLSLFFAGLLIALVSPPSPALWSWEAVGFLLMALSLFVLVAIPGALVALRHPWGDGWRLALALEKQYAHPRLAGLALVWGGVVLPGWWAATILLRFPFSIEQTQLLTWAVGLVVLAPVLALLLFDRRR